MQIVPSAVRIVLLYIDVEHGHQLGQPRGLLGFIYKVVIRQKLKLTNGFCSLLWLLQICLLPLSHASEGRKASDE